MPSSYFSKLRSAIQRSIVGKEGGIQDPVEILIGQGKLRFGNSRLFHSLIYSSCLDLHVLLRPGTIFTTSSELVNQKRNLSVVGTVSRTLSTPSISGPSFQVCGYHIDCALAGIDQIPTSSIFRCKTMDTCVSTVINSNFLLDNSTPRRFHYSLSTNGGSSSSINRVSASSRRLSMRLTTRKQPDNHAICGYFIYNAAKNWCSPYSSTESGSRDFHSSSSLCFSTGTAPDVAFDTSGHEELLANSADSFEQTPSGKTLKLLSGSCYLPHPDKEETGGEDAHFICLDEQALGVADGVGGWSDLGVNAGLYSRELMSNSANAIKEEPKGSIDPARVLEKAHSSTKAKGSSTACIIALTGQGLHAINLGDSGFMVVRDGSGQVFSIPVAPGDVIIAGTDGLFDNLYNNEITAVVVHAMRTGSSPQVTAQKIAALARQRAHDRDRQTPFSTAAHDAGFRFYGGKLDDTTVVVSYITSSNHA
ncbi:putative Protein phosphatase 2c [Quillaja saponaria]|uniref:Protein phosphatase n=1 Tax=Quillaja saponaria TaxID=32244 RepID=A0AAD7PSM7_QUISA|nr:putative Protein phosphatase 2c [Quillaja saponaria]